MINNGKIEGVPDGWRLIAFRPPRQGEYYVSAYTGEVLELIDFGPFCSVAIVVPDNVYGVRDPLKDVLAPHGYRAVDFRVPQHWESWITRAGSIADGFERAGPGGPHVIIEPLPPPPKPKRKVMVCDHDIVKSFGPPCCRMEIKEMDVETCLKRYPDQCRIEERDA